MLPEFTPPTAEFIAMITLYISVCLFIGYLAHKKTKTLADFFIMGGTGGAIVTGLGYFTTQISASTYMGCPGYVYRYGLVGLISVIIPGTVLGLVIPGFLVGRRVVELKKKLGYLTFPDLLADRYYSNIIRLIAAIFITLYLSAYIAAQIRAGGVIFEVFGGLPYALGVIVTGIIVTIYCLLGGIRGALWTDVFQGLLMWFAAAFAVIGGLKLVGGIESLIEYLKVNRPETLSMPGAEAWMTVPMFISQALLWCVGGIGQPQLFTKFYAMKDKKVLARAIIAATLSYSFPAALIVFSGIFAIKAFPGLTGKEIDYVIPLIFLKAWPTIIAAFFMMGIFAAAMSTVDSQFVMVSGAIARDLYQKLINPTAPERKVLWLSRIVVLILGVIAVAVGLNPPAAIFTIVMFAWGGLGVFTIPIVLGLYWKRTTREAAIAGIIAGNLTLLALYFGPPEIKALGGGFHPLIPAWIVTLITMIIVSYLSPRPPKEIMDKYFAE